MLIRLLIVVSLIAILPYTAKAACYDTGQYTKCTDGTTTYESGPYIYQTQPRTYVDNPPMQIYQPKPFYPPPSPSNRQYSDEMRYIYGK